MNDSIQRNAPRPFDLSDPGETRRLLHETIGYMRVSLHHGSDTEGRRFALDGLRSLANLYAAPSPVMTEQEQS